MSILTPSGQMDAALQSLFRKAQMSDEAVQAAENVSQMEMENNAQHNMECAALVCFHILSPIVNDFALCTTAVVCVFCCVQLCKI